MVQHQHSVSQLDLDLKCKSCIVSYRIISSKFCPSIKSGRCVILFAIAIVNILNLPDR